MGKVNTCLKCVFIFFNALFHVIGWLGIIGAVISLRHGIPIIAWVLLIGIICISVLGIYGSYRENALALKIFVGCMVVGMVVTLVMGTIVVVKSEQFRDGIRNGSITMPKEQAESVDKIHQISMGVLFGLFAAAVLSLGMSSMMIHQIKHHAGATSFSM